MTTVALVMLAINSGALAVAAHIMQHPHKPNTIPFIAFGVWVLNIAVWLYVS